MLPSQKAVFASLLSAGLFAVVSSSWAGPPFVTDDPEPVEFKHIELYIGGTYTRERSGNSASGPVVEFNYGALPDLQLHIITPFVYNHPRGEESHYGYGDTELGLKYRFVHESEKFPQVATFPLLELPTGDRERGLGNGKVQVFLPLWLQKSWNKWTAYGGGGWWYNPGSGNRNYWRFGAAIQRELGDHWLLGGELFHETPAQRRENGHTGFDLGGAYNFTEHHHLLFSAGRDIEGSRRFTCYLAYQLTL